MTPYKCVYSQDSRGRADKVNRRIFTAGLGRMLFLFLCFRKMQRRLRVIPRGRFGKGRVDCDVLHFIIQNLRDDTEYRTIYHWPSLHKYRNI